MIFSNNLGKHLAEKVSKKSGISLGNVLIEKFKDGEIRIKIKEHIDGKDIFVLGCLRPPADNILEFILLVDAVKRLNPRKVTLIIPYLGYSRQDRYFEGEPLSGEVVVGMINSLNTDRVITVDIHSPRILRMINNYENISAITKLAEHFQDKEVTVVAPDKGAIENTKEFADILGANTAYLEKYRPEVGISEIMNIQGEISKDVLILDDMIDSGGTIIKAAEFLKEKGAENIYVAATHGLFSNGFEKFENSDIKEIIITDTIPQEKGKIISIADLIVDSL